MPIRVVYLTSDRTRKLRLGRSEITLKHAPRWIFALGSGHAGAAVRALAWMGPNHVHECLAALRRTLPPSEWRTLTSARAALPSWMARAIGEYRHQDGTRNKRLQPSGGLAAWGEDEAGAADQRNADGGE